MPSYKAFLHGQDPKRKSKIRFCGLVIQTSWNTSVRPACVWTVCPTKGQGRLCNRKSIAALRARDVIIAAP
jgi:hypothetical protein